MHKPGVCHIILSPPPIKLYVFHTQLGLPPTSSPLEECPNIALISCGIGCTTHLSTEDNVTATMYITQALGHTREVTH